MAFSPFAVGSSQPLPHRREMSHVRRSKKARHHPALLDEFDTPASDASCSSSSSPTSSYSAAVNHEVVAVFGPSHPLYSLVSAHLPDVLTRLVLAYQSPLLPRQQHYHGHILLPYGSYGFRDQRQQRMAGNPLSLARRSFSWSGWMNRSPSARGRMRNHFLLSFQSHDKGGPSQWLHIGYRQHSVRHKSAEENRAFAFAFNGNDLDARPAHTELELFGGWEHWSGSFEYPRPQTTPPLPIIPHTNESYASEPALHPPAGTVLGRRRLYRNGALVVEDDCIPLTADVCSTLVVGNYENHGHDMSLDGGVCDVRLYSRVLSEAEMRALYEGEEHEVGGEGLEAHWPLESDKHFSQTHGVGGTIFDVSGNERHLELRRLHTRHAVLSRHPVHG